MAPRVLLVGEIGMRLEVEFIGAGLACTVAPTAAAGVAWMRQSPFPVVVVPQALPDMPGQAFARGLLQHFPDVIVLLYGGSVDAQLESFVKEGRVVPVPEQTSTMAVADYVRRRLPAQSAPPSPVAEPTALGALGPLGPPPSALGLPPGVMPVLEPLPRARTSAPVPVVMLEPDGGGANAKQVADLQARIGAAEWALNQEKQARAAVDRALFEAREQLKVGPGEDATVRLHEAAAHEIGAATRLRDAMAAERDRAQAERDELNAAQTSTRLALEEAKEIARALEAERDDFKKRLVASAGAASLLQAQLDDERIAASQARADTDRARAELERARNDLVEVNKAARAAEDAKARSAAAADAARADVVDAQAATSAVSAQLDAERRGRVADADAAKAAQAALDLKVANHAEALRRVAVELKTQMDATKAAKAETVPVRARVAELEAAVTNAQTSAQAALVEGKLTDHDKRKLEARAADLAREIEEARKKADEAREEMFKARQLRDDAELLVADLELQIVDLKQSLDTTRKELVAAQQRVAELSTQVDELRVTKGRDAAELQLLEGRLDVATRERDRALLAVTDASRKLMELEDARQAS